MAPMSRDRRGPRADARDANRRAGKTTPRAATLKDRVRGRVSQELNQRKNRVTEALDGVAETVRRVGEPLREAPYGALGGYVQTAADRIEQLATDLRQRDVDELAQDLGEFARTRPAVFVGATLAAGIVAARLLKSSRSASE